MTSHEFVLDGDVRMHVLMSGGSVETLYIHGVGGSAWTFESTLRAMPQTHSWACVDLLGYGSSSWLSDADYSTRRQVTMLRRVIDHFERDSIQVVGFSWGGLIGLELARQDSRVTKLVMADIPPATAADPDDVPAAPATYNTLGEATAAVLGQAPRAPEAVAIREALLSTRPTPGGLEKRIDPVLLRRWQFRAENHWDALREAAQEILLIRAEHSPLLSAETAAEMVAAANKATLVEIPGSGHLIPLEQPALFAAAIADFLG